MTPKPTAETVYSFIHRCIDEGNDSDAAAARLLRTITKAELGKFITPLLLNEGHRYERTLTRRIEAEVDARLAAGEDPISVRRKLVGESFPLPGVGLVKWVEATPEQHLARAAWQRTHAAASIADAERHEAAAALIEEHGVTCLADLLEAEVA